MPSEDLRPNWVIVLIGTCVIALISAASLPWPIAILSTLLGGLMIAGADVDARTYLLPDLITWTAILAGILAALAFNPTEPWVGLGSAIARAAGTALVLALVRWSYAWFRKREGVGLGDIKLAAAVGAWLPLESIPLCFGLAASAALITAAWVHLRGEPVQRDTRLAFGAFLCPALWLVFYASALPS